MKTKVLTKQDKVYTNWPFYLAVLISYHSLLCWLCSSHTSLLFLEHTKDICASGALHLPFSLLRTLFHQVLLRSSHIKKKSGALNRALGCFSILMNGVLQVRAGLVP